MTSPLPPRIRDTTDLDDLVRQQKTNLRQLGVGFVGGRFPPARPRGIGVQTSLATDEEEGDDETIVGQDTDRLTLSNLGTQTWTLAAEPIEETLVVRWHPGGGAGIEWKRGDHYTLSDEGGVVTIPATSLTNIPARVGDVFSAQYLRIAGDDVAEPYTIDYSATGWSYLVLPGNMDTNTTNHSGDDFAEWPVGQMPIGIAGSGPIAPSTQHPNTTTDAEILWVARTCPATEAMTIKVVVEDNGEVFVNGTSVLVIPEHGSGSWPEQSVDVPAELLNAEGDNVVMMRVANETPITIAGCYVDIKIIATVAEA